MLIEGIFSSKGPEKIIHKFQVNNVKENITIFLKKCIFEHIIVILKDPKGVKRGTFTLKTYSRSYSIFKDFNRTSNLFKEGEIESGEWSLTLIKNYDCQGEYSIEILEDIRIYEGNIFKKIEDGFRKKEKDWYFGELHCHSNFSDGKISQLELYNGYKKKQLDYLFLTDHNVISNKGIEKNWNFFSGTELTLDNHGHFNIYGVKEIDYENVFCEDRDPGDNVREILKEVKKDKDTMISLNHPFQKNTGPSHNISMDLFDTIEIINCPYKESEDMIKKTIKAFDYLWEKGYKIFGVAGSDTHKVIEGYETTVGIPKNVTNLKSEFSEKELLKAIKNGKNYITFDKKVKIDIFSENKKYSLGDEVKEKVNFKIESSEKIYWHGILNGKILFKDFSNKVNRVIKLNNGEYFRIDGYDCNGKICYFFNPIYNNITESEKLSWFDIKNYIEREE